MPTRGRVLRVQYFEASSGRVVLRHVMVGNLMITTRIELRCIQKVVELSSERLAKLAPMAKSPTGMP